MTIKAALHVHTTSSDGTLSPAEAAEEYARLGFGLIAITDHDFMIRQTVENVQRETVRVDLIVCQGVEITVFEKGYLHVTRIQGDREILHVFNHPAQLHLPLEKVMDRIRGVAQKLPIDAVEITSNGFYTPEYDVREIPYPKIATDDSHTRMGCGRAWVEVEGKPDKDGVIRAIKRGEFRNCFLDR